MWLGIFGPKRCHGLVTPEVKEVSLLRSTEFFWGVHAKLCRPDPGALHRCIRDKGKAIHPWSTAYNGDFANIAIEHGDRHAIFEFFVREIPLIYLTERQVESWLTIKQGITDIHMAPP